MKKIHAHCVGLEWGPSNLKDFSLLVLNSYEY